MKRIVLFTLLIGLGILFGSCKKDGGGGTTIPDPPALSDFTFPASGASSATLYAPTATVVVNQEFDIRFILYNVTDAFGAATEITFPSDKIQVTADPINYDFFTPESATLGAKGVVSAGVYAVGITYRNGTNRTTSGSGAVMKLRCKAVASGTVAFTLTKLEVKKADGTLIALPSQSVTVTIQ